MTEQNWTLIKSQYELLNHPIEQIALDHNVSTAVIEYAIERKGWQRQNLAKALQELDENHDDRDRLIDSLALLKEATLLPQYVAVESALLDKALQLLESIPPGIPAGTVMLRAVEKVFTSLAQTQGLISRVRQENSEQKNQLQINIMNKVESAQ